MFEILYNLINLHSALQSVLIFLIKFPATKEFVVQILTGTWGGGEIETRVDVERRKTMGNKRWMWASVLTMYSACILVQLKQMYFELDWIFNRFCGIPIQI